MLQRATLAGVQGAADLHFRHRNVLEGTWVGAFVYRIDDEWAIARVMKSGGPAVLETSIEGQRRAVPVTITSFTDTGLAFFQACERPAA